MNVYLVPGLKAGPVVIERLARLIGPERLDQALIADRFTPREVIAHMADWEPVALARMQQALAQPGSAVEDWDEGRMAIEHGYAESNIEEQLAHFAARRMQTIAFIESVSPENLTRTIHHPGRGVMSIDDQASLMLGHDMYHCEQLSAYLSRGTGTAQRWS